MFGENMCVHTFPRGICPKMNRLAQLVFKLSYYDVTVQHIGQYATAIKRVKQIIIL